MSDWNKDEANTPESEARDEADAQNLESEVEPEVNSDVESEANSASEENVAVAAQPAEANVAESNAPKAGMPAWPWIVVSGVAVAALAVVLIINPFGGSNEKLVKYDGGSLTKADFYDSMQAMYGDQVSQMVESFAENNLIQEQADKAGVIVTDELISKEIATFADRMGGMEALQQALDQQGLTLDQLKQNQVAPELLKKLLYQQQNPVTDADIQKYADANKDEIAAQKRVRASHILVKTKEEADAIEAELKAGKDFAELAKAKSTDTGSAVNGGDLDFFGQGQMVPEFEEAAFKLKKDEVSEPVKSDFGYHIIKVTDIQEPDVNELYWQEQISTNGTTWLDKLKKDNHWEKVGEKDEADASPTASAPASAPAATESPATK